MKRFKVRYWVGLCVLAMMMSPVYAADGGKGEGNKGAKGAKGGKGGKGAKNGDTSHYILEADPPPSKGPGVLKFNAENIRYKAEGHFIDWKFTKVDIPGGDIEKGTVEIEIDIMSIWEKTPGLNEHLQQEEALNPEKFPKAKVTVKDAKKVAAEPAGPKYTATAVLEFKGLTGEWPVEFIVLSESPLKIEGMAKVDRDHYNVFRASNPDSPNSPTKMAPVKLTAIVEVGAASAPSK